MWSLMTLVGLRPVDVEFDARPPTDEVPADELVVMFEPVASVSLPDMVVQSSFAPVTCEVRDGLAGVWFTATRDTWPAAWPATATCSHGPVTWTLQLRPCAGAWCRRRDRPPPLRPCAEPWLEDWSSPDGPPDSLFTQGCTLPRDGTGFVPPADTGKTWPALRRVGPTEAPATDPLAPGVTCALSGRPEHPAQVVVATVDRARIAPGTYCPLARPDGSAASAPLTLAR